MILFTWIIFNDLLIILCAHTLFNNQSQHSGMNLLLRLCCFKVLWFDCHHCSWMGSAAVGWAVVPLHVDRAPVLTAGFCNQDQNASGIHWHALHMFWCQLEHWCVEWQYIENICVKILIIPDQGQYWMKLVSDLNIWQILVKMMATHVYKLLYWI